MSYFVLADCNNFFVSCEKLLNPSLEGQPVVVLSNMGGCIVARSQEAKALGISMGVPYFQIRDFCERMKVVSCCCNHSLYQTVSVQVMEAIAYDAEEMEIYSIDEAFLLFSHPLFIENKIDRCISIKERVKEKVGIPISLGIASTKTLAKLANDLAKKEERLGVFDLTDASVIQEILSMYPVGDIWGIGKKMCEKLHKIGIRDALELSKLELHRARSLFGVHGERIVLELQGVRCYPLSSPSPKKSISYARLFEKIISDKDSLSQKLSAYVCKACEHLREEESFAKGIEVSLESLIDAKLGTRHIECRKILFSEATNDTSSILSAAKEALFDMYEQTARYKKCGITLLDLIQEKECSSDLFELPHHKKRRELMKTIDALNKTHGKTTLFFGANLPS